MTNPNPENHSTTTVLNPQEFGLLLRRQREQRGLSIGEISERLKLPARQIEALEKGDYESLPEPVFIRGFLRSYGRFLDFPEEQLDQYLSHFSPPVKVSHSGSHHNLNYTNQEIKKPFPTWIFGVVAAALIGYGIYAWQNKSQTENAKQEQNTSMASMPVAVSAPNLSNDNIIVKPMAASETAQSASQTAASAMPQSASGTAQAALSGELLINTRYRTMLTVTNAQGEVLINQIVPGRSEHRFTNGAPFEVRLGYAIGSSVSFGGSEIDIDAVRKGGKTAVFTAGDANTPVKSAATVQ